MYVYMICKEVFWKRSIAEISDEIVNFIYACVYIYIYVYINFPACIWLFALFTKIKKH